MHIEFLVEEPSVAEALRNVVPKLVTPTPTLDCHVYEGKRDLLRRLMQRLKGYAASGLSEDMLIVVLVDEDRQDCHELKAKLESAAADAGLKTQTTASHSHEVQVLNRILIEELESWFFGDVAAVVTCYPRVPASLGQKAKYRDPDRIKGGTWEELEKVLQKAGYYGAGMPKAEVARRISAEMEPSRNRSSSFQLFAESLRRLQR